MNIDLDGQIDQTANVILKAQMMKKEYERALTWVTKELSELTPTDGFSMDEKKAKLIKSESDILLAMEALEKDMQTMEAKMKESSIGTALLFAAKAKIEIQGVIS